MLRPQPVWKSRLCLASLQVREKTGRGALFGSSAISSRKHLARIKSPAHPGYLLLQFWRPVLLKASINVCCLHYTHSLTNLLSIFFHHKRFLKFTRCLSWTIQMDLTFLSFSLLIAYVMFIDLHTLIHPCISRIDLTWLWRWSFQWTAGPRIFC